MSFINSVLACVADALGEAAEHGGLLRCGTWVRLCRQPPIRCPFVTFGPPDGLTAKRGKNMRRSKIENTPRVPHRQGQISLIFRNVSGAVLHFIERLPGGGDMDGDLRGRFVMSF
jgi:hypothetical protein